MVVGLWIRFFKESLLYMNWDYYPNLNWSRIISNSYPTISLSKTCSNNENFMSRKIRTLAYSKAWTIFSFLPLNVSGLTVVLLKDIGHVNTLETRLSILMDTDLSPRLGIPRVVLLSKFCWEYLLKMWMHLWFLKTWNQKIENRGSSPYLVFFAGLSHWICPSVFSTGCLPKFVLGFSHILVLFVWICRRVFSHPYFLCRIVSLDLP